MAHLNYCRSILKAIDLERGPRAFADYYRAEDMIGPLKRACRFSLPVNGRIIDDPGLRGLDEDLHLKLPFPLIAVEVRLLASDWDFRTVLVAWDGDGGPESWKRDGDDTMIAVQPIVWNKYGRVEFGEHFKIPTTGYLDRKVNDPSGRPRLALVMGKSANRMYAESFAYPLLSLLNSLACSNVKIETDPPKQTKRKSPFTHDSYHFLTIETHRKGSASPRKGGYPHRSPREHLRRGHIRRLATNVKVWVNAAVVASGNGGGKITKDYRLRGPKP